MPETHVFTCAAANYLPKVRVLFASLAEHEPQWRRHLVLIEDEQVQVAAGDAGAHEVHRLADLDIAQWHPWSFCHSLVELATAAKPFALKALLQRPDSGAVVYLDPDTVAFSPLPEIAAGIDTASVLLTPHLLAPETALGRAVDNEVTSLCHGVYNLGFIAVAADATGQAFAEWWSQRLYRFCRDDIPHGLFTDQRWIDLVPALFPGVAVLREPRLNAASWNLSQRELSVENGQFLIAGQPLGFYHFTSIDSGSHDLMALKNSAYPPALRELVDWYRGQLDSAPETTPWSLGDYADGTAIPAAHRRIYRDSPALQERHPQPYGDVQLKALLQERAAAGEGASPALEPLSLGFGAADDSLDSAKLARLLRAVLANPRLGGAVARRAAQVLGREGIGGVLRRLR